MRDNPLPARAWPGLLSPVRNRLQSQRTRCRGQHPRRRALSRRPGAPSRAGRRASTQPRRASACWWSAPGPSGLSAAYHLTRLGHAWKSTRPGRCRRHAAFRHSRLSPAARRADDGDRADRAHGRADRAEPQGRRPAAETTRGRLRRGVRRDRRACRPSMSTSPPATPPGCSTRWATCATSAAGAPPLLGRRVVIYGGGNTAMDAARTARRLGADEAMIVYRRDRAHMPAHAFEADEAIEEGVKIKWLTTIKDFAGHTLTVERMDARRRRPPGADRRVRDAGGRRGRARARPGHRQRLPAHDVPGIEVQDRRHGRSSGRT